MARTTGRDAAADPRPLSLVDCAVTGVRRAVKSAIGTFTPPRLVVSTMPEETGDQTGSIEAEHVNGTLHLYDADNDDAWITADDPWDLERFE